MVQAGEADPDHGGLVLPEAPESNDALRAFAPDSESPEDPLHLSVDPVGGLLAFHGVFGAGGSAGPALETPRASA